MNSSNSNITKTQILIQILKYLYKDSNTYTKTQILIQSLTKTSPPYKDDV